MNRPAPRHDIVTKPQFFHRSRFREHPDHDYEARVDDSLRKIEEKVRTGHQGSLEATGTVWQIMLAPDKKHIDRSPDSIAFELENRDWNYKGRLLETHPLSVSSDILTSSS